MNGTIETSDGKVEIFSNNSNISIESCKLTGNFQTSNNGKITVKSGIFGTYLSSRFIDDQKRITTNTDSSTKKAYPYTLKTVATDTSWYNSTASSFTLYNTEDLEGLAKLVNNGINFSGKSIYLSTDFTNTGSLTTVIGDYGPTESGNATFNGNFNGINKQIKVDIDITTAPSTIYAGIFGVTNGAQISNIRATGTIDVNVKGIKVYVGGLVGFAEGKNRTLIDNCIISTKINSNTTNKHSYAGGIVGKLEAYSLINYSSFEGTLKSVSTTQTAMAGGICGATNSTGKIINSYSKGDLTASSISGVSYAGGIVGISETSVENCYSLGTVKATCDLGNAYPAGLVGYTKGSNAKIYNCYSKASVDWDSVSGYGFPSGITAYYEGTSSISYCYYIGSTPISYSATTLDNAKNIYEIDETNKIVDDKNNASLVACLNYISKESNKSGNSLQYWKLDSDDNPVFGSVLVASFSHNGGTYSYASLQNAIDDLYNLGVTTEREITLLVDTIENISVSKGQNIILNLNSKSLTAITLFDNSKSAISITNGSKVTIKNGTVRNNVSSSINNNGGTVVIESGNFVGTITSNNDNVTIKSGLFTSLPNSEYIATGKRWILNTDKETRYEYIYAITDKVNADRSWYSDKGGTSIDNPYLIHNTAQLEGLALLVNGYAYDFKDKYIKLADDFDGSVALKTVIGNGNWLLISEEETDSASFRGHFDGNSKEVKLDLVYQTSAKTIVSGMFGLAEDADISNLIVSGDINILTTRKVNCGAIVAHAINCTFSNCSSKVNIDVETTSETNYCGGIVGVLKGGIITDSSSTGDIKTKTETAKASSGGLVGVIENSGTIKNCYSRGDITAISKSGNAYSGGFAGINQGYIICCYSTGNMTATSTSGTKYTGGLVAENAKSATVRKSYAVYNETLIGTNSGSDLNNYKIVGKNVVGKSTVVLLDQLNENASKFNLSPWEIKTGQNNGYPIQITKPRVAYINLGTEEEPDLSYFVSVQDAIDYCNDKGITSPTITLISDVTENIEIYDIDDLTIDLGGYVLTGDESSDDEGDYCVIELESVSGCIIKNGTIVNNYSKKGAINIYGIYCSVSNNVTFDNLTIDVEYKSSSPKNSIYGICALGSDSILIKDSTINVAASDSTFSCVGVGIVDWCDALKLVNTNIHSPNEFLSVGRECSAEIESGKYYGSIWTWDSETEIDIYGGIYSEVVDTEFLRKGYYCVDNTDSNTKTLYPKMVSEVYVAQIGDVKYTTLEEARDAAELIATDENPVEIKVIFDAILSNEVRITQGKKVSFNLNGHKLTAKDINLKVSLEEEGLKLVERLNAVKVNTTKITLEEDITFDLALEIAKKEFGETFPDFVQIGKPKYYVIYSYDTKYHCIKGDVSASTSYNSDWDEENSYEFSLDELKDLIGSYRVYAIGEVVNHVHNWSYEQISSKSIKATCINDYCDLADSSYYITLHVSPSFEYGENINTSYGKTIEGLPYPELTYYVDKDCLIKTTEENSGAEDEGDVPTYPGTYYIKSANLGSLYLKASFTIETKKLNVEGLTIESSKYYDGNTSISVTNQGTLSGMIGEDEVYIDTVVANTKDKNAGSNKDVIITYTLKGKDSYKYSVKPQILKASIKKIGVTVYNTEINDKSYDGTDIATVSKAGDIKGTLSGDKVYATIKSANFVDKNVGENKVVKVEYSLSGADAINYVVTSNNTFSANISKTNVSVTDTKVELEKDGSNYIIKVKDPGTLNGIFSGDNVTIKDVNARFLNEEDKSIGVVTIDYTLEGKDAKNYIVSSNSVTVQLEETNNLIIIIGAILLVIIIMILIFKKKKDSKY